MVTQYLRVYSHFPREHSHFPNIIGGALIQQRRFGKYDLEAIQPGMGWKHTACRNQCCLLQSTTAVLIPLPRMKAMIDSAIIAL